MDLRFHGPFPPKVESGIPGTIEAKAKQDQAKSQNEEYEPLCLLQAWAEPQENGKIVYLFLLYGLQVPPWVAAEQIVSYFRLNPTYDHCHTFVEVVPPNNELQKPVYSRFNFKWEWQKSTWVKRGTSWVWQSSGHGVVRPYSESPITMEEETLYEQQLEQLMIEVEQEHKKPALAQAKPRLYLPTFTRSQPTEGQLVIPEKSTSTN